MPCPCHQLLVIKSHPHFPSGRFRRCSPRETNTLGRLELPVLVRRGYFLRAMLGGTGKPITSVVIQMGSGALRVSRSCRLNVSCQNGNFTLTGGRLPGVAGSALSQPLAGAVFVAFITTLCLYLCCPARLCSPGICASRHLALQDQGMTTHNSTDCTCGCLLSPWNQARLSEFNPLWSGQVI